VRNWIRRFGGTLDPWIRRASLWFLNHALLLFCRWTLETAGTLDPRISALEDDFEEEEEEEEEEDANGVAPMEMDDARVGCLVNLGVAHTPVSCITVSSLGLLLSLSAY
jgi:hypothetical protein